MRLWFAAVMLLVLAGLAMLGFYRVPGVQENGAIAAGFQTSAFLEVLSFLLTAAFIGPLTAEFVEWRHKQEWKPARQTACERLNKAMSEVFDAYRTFISRATEPVAPVGKTLASQAMTTLIRQLDRFLDIYDEEHPVFDPPMHSAGSPVRRRLVEFRNLLQVTRDVAEPNRAVRLQMGRHDLDKLRALFDKQRLGRAAAPTPVARDAAFAPEEPVTVETDMYFSRTDELFFDAQIRVFDPGGTLPRFEPVDLAELGRSWTAFLASAPSGGQLGSPFAKEGLPDAGTQLGAYLAWLALFKGYNPVLDILIDANAPPEAPVEAAAG